MIDWIRVEELHSEVGEEDFVEIIELFLEEMQDSVASLDSLQPGQTLSDTLHSIKGSAYNLGFQAVAELCAAGERDPAAVENGVLKTSLGASIEALTTRYKTIS